MVLGYHQRNPTANKGLYECAKLQGFSYADTGHDLASCKSPGKQSTHHNKQDNTNGLHCWACCMLMTLAAKADRHSEPKGWGPLRLCLFIICICTSVDSDSHDSSCRSHYKGRPSPGRQLHTAAIPSHQPNPNPISNHSNDTNSITCNSSYCRPKPGGSGHVWANNRHALITQVYINDLQDITG
jgi:hypothetical protein